MNLSQAGGVVDERAVAPTGTYVCALVDVQSIDRPEFQKPDVMVPNFRWVWETTEVGDDGGRAFRFTKYTKTWFGGEQANLTKLIDMMFGRRLTSAEYSKLDVAQLQKMDWLVTVTKTYSQTGREVNTIDKVEQKQAVAPTRKLAKPALEPITDPFEE